MRKQVSFGLVAWVPIPCNALITKRQKRKLDGWLLQNVLQTNLIKIKQNTDKKLKLEKMKGSVIVFGANVTF